MRIINILLCVVVLLIISGCSEKSEMDILDTLTKTEEHFKQLSEVDTVATSFDGKKDIKFRIMVEGTLTEKQAQTLFEEILNNLKKYSNQSKFWNSYNGYFDIKNYDNGVIYEATKIIGADLKIVTK
ncbi:hypothetical protein H9635_03850 [Solibacillus sp. A46]|uniref:Uncharacterized protein n=1 Tax=Solibacillus faecavium TaxID=2762221 RepID=A0ABR8XVA6_9BACL|nr:hypothetical protein [Solibacillus faecavium]MBD8035862.1 hypothetical protein [Solibacillus faecavium]